MLGFVMTVDNKREMSTVGNGRAEEVVGGSCEEGVAFLGEQLWSLNFGFDFEVRRRERKMGEDGGNLEGVVWKCDKGGRYLAWKRAAMTTAMGFSTFGAAPIKKTCKLNTNTDIFVAGQELEEGGSNARRI